MLLLVSLVCGCGASTDIENDKAKSVIVYENFADDFANLWESTQGASTTARREAFRRDIIPLFDEFYGPTRFQSEAFGNPTLEDINAFTDNRIDQAFANFEDIRVRYIDKMDQFDSRLEQGIADFKRAFPDFKLQTKIYLVHSLGEMDGGTRTLNGETVLIFGADGMTSFHEFDDERAFFLHELFHVYHQDRFGYCQEIWCDAWREGMAVYASQQLVPDASPVELLVDYPIGTLARVDRDILKALEHLRKVGELSDQGVYSALFQTSLDETALPPRRGYYLGYLIIKEAGLEMTVSQLASLSAEEARPIYERSINRLITRFATSQ